MTGPEHYRRAEELLAEITNDDGSVGFGDGGEAYALAAQVHATLALAAATALLPFCDPDSGLTDFDLDAWRDAAGAKHTPKEQA